MSLNSKDGLPEYGFVKLEAARKLLGVSKTTMYRDIKDAFLPPPIHLTRKLLGWPVEVIREFLDARRGGEDFGGDA